MATVTIYPVDDGFNYNVSGFYHDEGFLVAKSSSSSNADWVVALTRWTTVGAGIGAGDTINSVTSNFYCYLFSDINGVSVFRYWTDVTDAWGTLDVTDPPNTLFPPAVDDGYEFTYTTGIYTPHALTTSIPKSGTFNLAINPELGDVGPGVAQFYDRTTIHPPYIVIDYTPASSSKQLLSLGVGQ